MPFFTSSCVCISGTNERRGKRGVRERGVAGDLSGVKFYCITFRKRHDGTRVGRGRCIMSINRASSGVVLRRGDPLSKFRRMRARDGERS